MRHSIILFVLLSFNLPFFVNASQWISFKLEDGHIKIPISVSGIEGFAILDSGAQINSINSAFIKKHKLKFKVGGKIKVKGVYGTEILKTFEKIPTELFGTKLLFDDVVEGFIGNHENLMILGAGLFRNFIIQLDYPNQQMRLFGRDEIDMVKLANVKMRFDKTIGLPVVNVSLNTDSSAWLVLDTGNAGGIMLRRSFANKYNWLDSFETEIGMSAGINGIGFHESFRLPEVKIGPYVLENVLTTVPAKNQKSNLHSNRQLGIGTRIKGKNVKGLLGYDVLKHFIVTLDYRAGNMHIFAP